MDIKQECLWWTHSEQLSGCLAWLHSGSGMFAICHGKEASFSIFLIWSQICGFRACGLGLTLVVIVSFIKHQENMQDGLFVSLM